MRGVNDNWSEQVKSLHLAIDQQRARALGVTSEHVATASQTILSGLPIGQYLSLIHISEPTRPY